MLILEILRLKVGVFQGCVKAGMPHNILQSKDVTAVGQKLGGEGVTECVWRTPDAIEASLFAESPQ